MNEEIDWSKEHRTKINAEAKSFNEEPDAKEWRQKIEPWLSAIFQSEHFSLLIGSGLTNAIGHLADINFQGMGRLNINGTYSDIIHNWADSSASAMERGIANLEDDFRAALELLRGYQILNDPNAVALKSELDSLLKEFIEAILETEEAFRDKLELTHLNDAAKAIIAFNYLQSFLLSFSSRAASRERLNIFTTNYDRFLEFGCDEVGIILLDRFKASSNRFLEIHALSWTIIIIRQEYVANHVMLKALLE